MFTKVLSDYSGRRTRSPALRTGGAGEPRPLIAWVRATPYPLTVPAKLTAGAVK